MKIKLKRFMRHAVIVLLAGAGGLLLGKYWMARELSKSPVATAHDAHSVEVVGNRFDPDRPPVGEKPAAHEPAPAEPPSIRAERTPMTTGANANPSAAPAPAATQPLRLPDASVLSAHAREALHLVGADSDADALWLEAINDPRVSAKDRKDLIEDLNESGLSDPKNPTAEDLPLIVARILLIESVIEHPPLDQTNADAFLEAYKDLLNLADVAGGRGEPVR